MEDSIARLFVTQGRAIIVADDPDAMAEATTRLTEILAPLDGTPYTAEQLDEYTQEIDAWFALARSDITAGE